jgi:hypothetical protein
MLPALPGAPPLPPVSSLIQSDSGFVTNHLSVSPDQELIEVPPNLSGKLGVCRFGRQKRIELTLIRSCAINLLKHWEAHLVVQITECLDFLLGFRLLARKVIAGKSKNNEALIL